MKQNIERNLLDTQSIPACSSWYALSSAWLGAVALTIALFALNWHLSATVQLNVRSSVVSSPSDESRIGADPADPANPVNFVATLPSLVGLDETIRFASRLAKDQDVRISQMHSEAVHADAKALGQVKVTLQLAGDYPHIKNVLIGLLAKFPGLTLQHLSIRHRDASSGNPTDKGSDEATLELIQYARPATMS